MAEVTLGGDRLGTGGKSKIAMRNYERSTHDLSYVFRSTAAAGTLIPFMSELGLPGDTFDIDLNIDVKTHPTIGPLFGSYKVQLDTFLCPIGLYNAKVSVNMLDIGRNMANIKLPQVRLKADKLYPTRIYDDLDNEQINPSCIFSYLGIRGVGAQTGQTQQKQIFRDFNAVPWLAYWDIYKNYYANKQEEVGAVIHNPLQENDMTVTGVMLETWGNDSVPLTETYQNFEFPLNSTSLLKIDVEDYVSFNPNTLTIRLNNLWGNPLEVFSHWEYNPANQQIVFWGFFAPPAIYNVGQYLFEEDTIFDLNNTSPNITMFELANIDRMRMRILAAVNSASALVIDYAGTDEPYNLPLYWRETSSLTDQVYSKQSSQEGLALKTYQSDLFNNWISTEWITGDDGVNAITAIDTSEGSFTLDTLNLSNKIYNMLNRIALSGGSYDDWIDAVFTHERVKAPNNPIYLGGLSKELVFQEVVSTASAAAETDVPPLGTLAGRGVMAGKHKGGKIVAKINDPAYIMGIVSLTPRLDYSQGNKWDMSLKTYDDFHKPALDEIGFQDLITDQMAWWDTTVKDDGSVSRHSAGKVPAWINYMTNYNRTYGNFAKQTDQMWMTLNRRYEPKYTGTRMAIKDLTTYIDPVKYNNIFADTRLDAQNFWLNIAVDITARRKMSAKVMPNL